MTDRVGQQFGNYQLVRLLGQGSFAQVYLGKHRYLNSYAALKVLNAMLKLGEEPKFVAEAQTLVDLRHPNIVHLLDFGIENGTPVLIMDYAPNGAFKTCPTENLTCFNKYGKTMYSAWSDAKESINTTQQSRLLTG